MAELSPSELLARATDVIEERGYSKYADSPVGPVSLIGACYVAYFDLTGPESKDQSNFRALMDLFSNLSASIGPDLPSARDPLAAWEAQPSTREESVTALIAVTQARLSRATSASAATF